jgi:hypothetical protein
LVVHAARRNIIYLGQARRWSLFRVHSWHLDRLFLL